MSGTAVEPCWGDLNSGRLSVMIRRWRRHPGAAEKRRRRFALAAQSKIMAAAIGLLVPASALALPDLMFYGPAANPTIVYRTYTSSHCEVVEGCATPGSKRVLSFHGQVRNLGPDDLYIGNPEDPNQPFPIEWGGCHGHWHMEDFAIYRLLDWNSTTVRSSQKMSFCLEDTERWSSTAPVNRRYSCSFQGIQAGWADVYDPAVPCQWVDITDLPGGTYTLELIIDPANHVPEANENNNVTRITVQLPGDCTAPANDAFANGQVISGSSASVIGNNGCATKEPGEPNHATDAGGKSIWCRWTAPASASTTISTVGSDFDTLLGVYTGSSVSALTLVATNDDIVPFEYRQSRLTFQATAGRLYHIAVDGWHAEYGQVVLNINPPPNDMLADCQALSGPSGSVTGHNIGATKEFGERAHAANIGGHSVWYCWTAPAAGTYVFDTFGSGFDTLLAVYTGSAMDNLVSVVSNDDFGTNNASAVKFNATAGANYKIAVDGFSGQTGNVALKWMPWTRPTLSIRKLGTSNVEVTVRGAPWSYELQASADTRTWAMRTNLTITGSPHVHVEARSAARQFYRVLSAP